MAGQQAVEDARAFLVPVLGRAKLPNAVGKSILQLLAPGQDLDDLGLRMIVIPKALHLLDKLYHAASFTADSKVTNELLYSSENRRVVDGLLDLVCLEGIYPGLPPGVGIPLEQRTKSALRGQPGISVTVIPDDFEQYQTLILSIIECIHPVVIDCSNGLHTVVQDRSIADLIAAETQASLAIQKLTGQPIVLLKELMEKVPVSVLLPALSSLIHPATPAAFKAVFSSSLSLLPLRADGVRQTIIFVASSTHRAQLEPLEESRTSSSPFSLDALNHLARLFASVPSTMTSETWFLKLQPQLLALLDENGTDLQRAASYIVSHGILGRKVYGAPGASGWKYFVLTIMDVLRPSKGAVPMPGSFSISSSNNLHQALHRLSSLALSYPNPGLLKRLVTPIILPLWTIICRTARSSRTGALAAEVLQSYLTLSVEVDRINFLVDNLLWDGENDWKYCGVGSEVELQVSNVDDRANNLLDLVTSIEGRVDALVTFVQSIADDAMTRSLFLHSCKLWLTEKPVETGSIILSESDWTNPIQSLIYAKTTQALLETSKSQITSNPDNIIELLDQVLSGYALMQRSKQQRLEKKLEVTMADMASIVPVFKDDSLEEENSEMVVLATSILSTLLSSQDLRLNVSTLSLLSTLKSTLTSLSQLEMSLSDSTLNSIREITSQILAVESKHISGNRDASIVFEDPKDQSRQAHAKAINLLSSPLRPVRAQGLANLAQLISYASPILDVNSTAALLISLLQDDDEYIYLGAIKALGILAVRHSRTVIGMLLDAYVDREEELPLDIRLRVGEAIRSTIQNQGYTLNDEVVKKLGESLVNIAGRRTQKPKTKAAKLKEAKRQEKETRSAKEAWDGEIPDDLKEPEADKESERLTRILEGWEGELGEEDLRMRTSALSLLAITMETLPLGLGLSLISTTVDLALAILKQETAQDFAIVRRAAALVVFSLTQAFDKADGMGKSLGFGLETEGLHEVLQVLELVRSIEQDSIVRGHLTAALEALGARSKQQLLGLDTAGTDIRFGLEGTMRGLDIGPSIENRPRPGIEEIE